MSNIQRYVARVKTIDEIGYNYNDNEDLYQMLSKYANKRLVVYKSMDIGNVFRCEEIDEDNELRMHYKSRFFYKSELDFIKKEISINLPEELFEL